jgi:hypothetical protein
LDEQVANGNDRHVRVSFKSVNRNQRFLNSPLQKAAVF